MQDRKWVRQVGVSKAVGRRGGLPIEGSILALSRRAVGTKVKVSQCHCDQERKGC